MRSFFRAIGGVGAAEILGWATKCFVIGPFHPTTRSRISTQKTYFNFRKHSQERSQNKRIEKHGKEQKKFQATAQVCFFFKQRVNSCVGFLLASFSWRKLGKENIESWLVPHLNFNWKKWTKRCLRNCCNEIEKARTRNVEVDYKLNEVTELRLLATRQRKSAPVKAYFLFFFIHFPNY